MGYKSYIVTSLHLRIHVDQLSGVTVADLGGAGKRSLKNAPWLKGRLSFSGVSSTMGHGKVETRLVFSARRGVAAGGMRTAGFDPPGHPGIFLAERRGHRR